MHKTLFTSLNVAIPSTAVGLGAAAFAASYAFPNSEHCLSAASHTSSPTPCISGALIFSGSSSGSLFLFSGLFGGVALPSAGSSGVVGDSLSGVINAFLVPIKNSGTSRLIEGGGSVIGLACGWDITGTNGACGVTSGCVGGVRSFGLSL